MREILARIERARGEGLDVTADAYPYAAAMNYLNANIPAWAHAGGTAALAARLRDPQQRARIKREMPLVGQYRQVGGAENIMIASCLNPALRKYLGRRLPEVARMMRSTPEDALLDLVLADGADVMNVLFLMSEDDVQLALRQPWVAFDTDQWALSTDGPIKDEGAHPRGFGAAARLLGHYARDLRLFSVEEAVRKMTSLPARRVGLADRGLIRPGMAADVVIFDPARVRDRATYEKPKQYPDGIRTVIVNGEIVLDKGRFTTARPGQVLTRGR
jgi:N-acyl-D-aspartate/D-glutamate deacylase